MTMDKCPINYENIDLESRFELENSSRVANWRALFDSSIVHSLHRNSLSPSNGIRQEDLQKLLEISEAYTQCRLASGYFSNYSPFGLSNFFTSLGSFVRHTIRVPNISEKARAGFICQVNQRALYWESKDEIIDPFFLSLAIKQANLQKDFLEAQEFLNYLESEKILCLSFLEQLDNNPYLSALKSVVAGVRHELLDITHSIFKSFIANVNNGNFEIITKDLWLEELVAKFANASLHVSGYFEMDYGCEKFYFPKVDVIQAELEPTVNTLNLRTSLIFGLHDSESEKLFQSWNDYDEFTRILKIRKQKFAQNGLLIYRPQVGPSLRFFKDCPAYNPTIQFFRYLQKKFEITYDLKHAQKVLVKRN